MEKITLNMTPSACLTTCHASQYDIGRQVRFDLVNGADAFVLSGAETVTLKIRRADGVLVENAVPNTSSNYVIWTSVAGECDAAGVSECELRVTDGDDVLGSANFLMSVEADAYDGRTQVKSASGAIATFETGLADALVSVLVNVLATGGNGTPDNPNPINGYTEANITRCGVNLWDEVAESGRYDTDTGIERPDASWTRSKNFIPVKQGSKIYIKSSLSVVIYCYGLDKSYISKTNRQNSTFTVPSGIYYLHITWNDNAYNNDISINYPASETDYHAYNGQTYTIAFGQTVYGGVLDVTRGKLHVTHGYALIDGVNLYGEYYYGDMVIRPNGVILATTDFTKWKCNIFTPSVSTIRYNTNQKFMFLRQSTWESTGATDAATFNAYCQNTPIQVVYELATPLDIDLTPEVISAVVGTNNVFAECGDIAVEYLDLL